MKKRTKKQIITGARDALKQSARMHRLMGDVGHATMNEIHADELTKLITPKPIPAGE